EVSLSARDIRDVSKPHSQAVGVLGLARVCVATAAGHRGWRRDDASRNVSPRARAGALERRLRAAVAPPRGWPLRRESEPAVQAPSVPGAAQARARPSPAAVTGQSRSQTDQYAA